MKGRINLGHYSLAGRVVENYGKLNDFLRKTTVGINGAGAHIEQCPVVSIVQHIADTQPTRKSNDRGRIMDIVHRLVMYKDPLGNLRELCEIYNFCHVDASNRQMLIAYVTNQIMTLSQNSLSSPEMQCF